MSPVSKVTYNHPLMQKEYAAKVYCGNQVFCFRYFEDSNLWECDIQIPYLQCKSDPSIILSYPC